MVVLVVLCALLIRLRRGSRGATVGRKCTEEPTPLERLEPNDISFLQEHPALARTLAGELRRERRKVLRQYVHALRRDFNETCAHIRSVLVNSEEDRPDLTRSILKQQILFKLALVQAECSMMFEALGFAEVDFDVIVGSLESIKFSVTRLFNVAPNQAS